MDDFKGKSMNGISLFGVYCRLKVLSNTSLQHVMQCLLLEALQEVGMDLVKVLAQS